MLSRLLIVLRFGPLLTRAPPLFAVHCRCMRMHAMFVEGILNANDAVVATIFLLAENLLPSPFFLFGWSTPIYFRR